MDQKQTSISKFLSLILRHKPETIGLTLDAEGWAEIADLLTRANAHGKSISQDYLHQIVRECNKQRFTLSADGTRIRAAQGHSAKEVAISYTPTTPPAILFHGTASRFLDSIKQQGLLPGSRHYVHLSQDEVTAQQVGGRHGKAVILIVQAANMHAAGHEFYLAENGVWLTATVPVAFLQEQR